MFTPDLESVDTLATHAHADLDALGALAGARLLCPRARAIAPIRFLPGADHLAAELGEWLGLTDPRDDSLQPARHVLLVDVQDPNRTDLPRRWVEAASLTWTVLDHHPPGPTPAPLDHRLIEPVGACVTLVTEQLIGRGIEPSVRIATAMLAGLLADTGKMSYPGTTPRDFRAAAWLLERGAELDRAQDYLVRAIPDRQLEVLAQLESRIDWLRESSPSGWMTTLEAQEEVSGLAALVNELLERHPAHLAVCTVTTPERTRIVARARSSQFDLLAALAPFDARGHASAITAVVTAPDHQTVSAKVRAICKTLLPPEWQARHLMSHPVHGVPLEATLKAAWLASRHWGLTVVPVLQAGRPQGVLHRRDLDRAIQHGLEDAPIRDILPRRVVQVSPETPMAEIERRMLRERVGRVLVVSDRQLVGIVSRTDLERGRMEGHAVQGDHQPIALNLAPSLAHVVERAVQLAGSDPLYLVGGAVRDLILGHPVDDVDLVTEGDAIALARRLASHLGASLVTHEPFGTARLTLADGLHLDVASARIEHYPLAAGLPEVKFARLHGDLRRRDFTINAMALRLRPGARPELIDPYHGREDLARGVLRTLHPVSFFEDPVRIFRGLRFAQRFNLAFEPETAAQAREAIASGRYDGMGGERLKLELRQACRQTSVKSLFAHIARLDAWRFWDPGLNWNHGARLALGWLDWLARRGAMTKEELLWNALGVLVATGPDDQREAVLERLLPTRVERRQALEAARAVSLASAWEMPWKAWSEGRRARAVREAGAPGHLVLAAATRDHEIRRWILQRWPVLARRKPSKVDGDWLRRQGVPPGPLYSSLLLELQEAVWERDTLDEEAWMLERLRAPSPGV